MSEPRVLLLGGCGFLGRHLLHYTLTEGLATQVRVVDKVPPSVAWLSPQHKQDFSDPRVEFVSANLIHPDSCRNAFDMNDGSRFTYVINLAAEMKSGRTDAVYEEGIVKLTQNCAREAASRGVTRYVEVSVSELHKSDKHPMKETDMAEPWTAVARHKIKAEQKLAETTGLDYVILRPAIVYGSDDRTGLTPRLVIGAVYKQLGEMMKLLWDADLRMNTVHVTDFCRAVWHVIKNGRASNIYHVVDQGNTTQGVVSNAVSEIFSVNHDYWGKTMSTVAKLDVAALVDEVNEKHLGPWAEACRRDGINNTPLSPYIHQEMLHRHPVYLDGSKLLGTGFTFLYPHLHQPTLLDALRQYADMMLFPPSLL